MKVIIFPQAAVGAFPQKCRNRYYKHGLDFVPMARDSGIESSRKSRTRLSTANVPPTYYPHEELVLNVPVCAKKSIPSASPRSKARLVCTTSRKLSRLHFRSLFSTKSVTNSPLVLKARAIILGHIFFEQSLHNDSIYLKLCYY